MKVRVLGAGVIGLACAWELTRRGHTVEVVDPAPGAGASHAAAGMLCPAGELWHGEEDLWRLGRESAALWPAFASQLGVEVHRTGTLLAGADAGDLQEIDRQLALLAAAGTVVEPLGRRELQATEPGLGRVAGGALLPEDHSVDPRSVVAALLARVPVTRSSVGLHVADPAYDVTVVATGSDLPEPFAHLVRPVRGEILRVRTDDAPRHVVRGLVHGEPVYVVPRAGSDEVVIGATSEEHDGPAVVTVEGVHRLLDAARQLLPSLDRAAFVEAIARNRPGTRDNLPLVGPSGVDGVVLAAGHYRHGVLLAPLTARLVADQLETGAVDVALDPRRPALEGAPA
ncbi:glycine oxidase ThiO [Nocardioides jiangxiensis]|uniref:glycine oxidase n=1 Tax=Nocardioides jiangxiensis TaxID=3064524 RepID=A0ABT9B6W6_9ACTN|nr:glycine oxidase ThiO [Nocardioides sp. WY-20]MDO7868878.1 glycine oxidase ThiO [Nocardioides sp. WY-20]